MENLNPDVALFEKKKQASKTWMLLDTNGDTMLLQVDEHAISNRVGIHSRDLRILDPLLSHPSTILGRERAIVLNLEHIKVIITAEEVLLRNPMEESVIPMVEELCRRLPVKGSDSASHEGLEVEGRDLDGNIQSTMSNKNVTGSDVPPFEFRALKVVLEAICSFLDARTTELETNAYPFLDELTRKVTPSSRLKFGKMRKLKDALTKLNTRVQKVRDELIELLDDDDYMADLFLTRKMLGCYF